MTATTTLARKCIACGQDNSLGGESCLACGSSLDLKLCPACDAINGAAADRCHACGDVFFSSAAGRRAIEGRSLTVLQEPYISKSSGRRRRRRFAAFLAVLAAMLSLPVYLLVSGVANRVAPVAKDQPAGVQQQAKVRTDVAKTTEATGAVTPAVTQPAGPVTGVTHTRRPDAPVAKTVLQERAPVVAPAKTAPVVQEKAAPTAALAAQAPAASAAPAVLEHPHVPVTHTKATPVDVAPAAAVAATSSTVPEASASAGKGRSPDCDPRVAALGFCNSNATSRGK